MRTLKIAAVCLLVSLFTVTCQKEHLPQESNGTPVFYFNGLVNGTNVSLQAGKNNYYMYSSDSQSVSGVYSYMGNLKEFNCNSGCVSSIKFIINDYRTLGIGAQEKNITDSSLLVTNYNYVEPVTSSINSYTEIFYPTVSPASATVTGYTFTFGDGTFQSDSTPLPAKIVHTYPALNTYTTSLTASFSGGLNSSLSVPVNATLHDTGSNSFFNNLGISTYTFANHIVFEDMVSNYVPSHNYFFTINFNDSASGVYKITRKYYNPASVDTVQHTFSNSTIIYTVSVRATDSTTGRTVNSSLNVNPGSATAPYANYTTSAPIITVTNAVLSHVTIIYTDPSGDVYTTADSAQPTTSNFQVTSIANYQNNENNQTTKQLHIKFNCTLYDNKKNPLTIKNGDAVIAVAYK